MTDETRNSVTWELLRKVGDPDFHANVWAGM